MNGELQRIVIESQENRIKALTRQQTEIDDKTRRLWEDQASNATLEHLELFALKFSRKDVVPHPLDAMRLQIIQAEIARRK